MSFRYFEAPAHAVVYNKFRHCPPKQLIESVVNYTKEKVSEPLDVAIDVGCGGGQSTGMLSPYFKTVIGFDPCDAQVGEAMKRNKLYNVSYRVGNAEKIDLPDNSVHLVAASQACHWFDMPKFYAEVGRILKPGAVIALYGYTLPKPTHSQTSKKLEDIVNKYYNQVLEMYVPPESKKVYLENYRSEAFEKIPFTKDPVIRNDSFSTTLTATVSDLVGYISSWSACQNYQKLEGEEKACAVLKNFEQEIMEQVGEHNAPHDTLLDIKYDYFLIMGRKPT